jgi:hypothetical protein
VLLQELLAHPAVQLPIVRRNEDFVGFLEDLLSRYTSLLFELTDPDDIVAQVMQRRADIQHFCHEVLEVVRSTFAGSPQGAYTHFVNAMTPLTDILKEQSVTGSTGYDLGLLYRVRRDSSDSLTREDLFHIPFEERYKVTTQRYSIPGVPCLYLGGSLYTCWAELGRPPFHELHVSAFWMATGHTVSILDFSQRPKRLLAYYVTNGVVATIPENRALLTRYLILWPLIALCSIVVKHRHMPYKPEYIIPQMVLQWITQSHAIDGVCYFSTHVESLTENTTLPTCNFVFPSRIVAPEGRCNQLRESWRLTKPCNWQVLDACNVGHGVSSYGNFEFEFIEGIRESYESTGFGRVETRLERLARVVRRGVDPNVGQVLP